MKRREIPGIEWLSTAADPNCGWREDAHGWKLHAVRASTDANLRSVKNRRAECGVKPVHGWDVDLFIEDRCIRCLRKLGIACKACKGKGGDCKSCYGSGEERENK